MRINFATQFYRNPLALIGAGLGAAGAVGKFFSGIKQTKEAKKINPVWQQYQSSPFAKSQLGLAQNLFGGRMFGAANRERNIYASQGNAMAGINRNATDSSQALALAAGAQGQADQSFANLQADEAQNKYSLLGNLNKAYGQMIGEGDKVHESLLQKYQMDAQRKDALMSSGAQNKFGAVSDLSSLALQGSQLFGGGGSLGKETSGVGNSLRGQSIKRLPFNKMQNNPQNLYQQFQRPSFRPLTPYLRK